METFKKNCLYCSRLQTHVFCIVCNNIVCTNCYNLVDIPACNVCNNFIIPNNEWLEDNSILLTGKYNKMLIDENRDFREYMKQYTKYMDINTKFCEELKKRSYPLIDNLFAQIDEFIDQPINGISCLFELLTVKKMLYDVKYKNKKISIFNFEDLVLKILLHNRNKELLKIYMIFTIVRHIIHNNNYMYICFLKITISVDCIIEKINNIDMTSFPRITEQNKLYEYVLDTINRPMQSVSNSDEVDSINRPMQPVSNCDKVNIQFYNSCNLNREERPLGHEKCNNQDGCLIVKECFPNGIVCKCGGRILPYKSHTQLLCVFCNGIFDTISNKMVNDNAFMCCWNFNVNNHNPYLHMYNKFVKTAIVLDLIYLGDLTSNDSIREKCTIKKHIFEKLLNFMKKHTRDDVWDINDYIFAII